MFLHASRDLEYRTPFGAQPTDEEVTIRFDASKESREVTFCYSYGLYGFSYHEEPMRRIKYNGNVKGTARYETRLMLPHEPGLVFYWFRFKIEEEVYSDDGDTEPVTEIHTKYYVMEGDTEDGSGKLYHEPPRIGADEDKYPYAWQITTYVRDYKTPDNMKGAMIYQIFPDRFARDKDFTCERMMNASPREERVYHEDWYEDVDIKGKPSTGYLACDFFGGSLKGIEEHLDYIKSIGIDIIYLNPIFEARSSHRYDTADYLNVDPMLGGNEAFASFKNACEQRGIRIILDGVFSHTGADSRYFNKFGRYKGVTGAFEAYEKGKESPYRSWYNFYKNEDGYTVYDSWWGFPDLPNVDENDLSYRRFIFDDCGVVDTWMGRGASGLRLDVSDELPDSFIRQMRDTIKSKTNGEGMLVGEVWEDASNKCSYGSYRDFMLGRTHDSVMGYTFRTAALEFLQGYVSAKVFNARLEGYRERYPMESYYCIMNLLSSHDVPRVYTMMSKPCDTDNKEDQQKICVPPEDESKCADLCKLGVALQIGYIGASCIYYGDEILMNGYKDPFNRRTYPWGKVSREGSEHLEYVRKLSDLRVKNQVLRTGFYRTLYTDEDVIVFERFLDNENRDAFGNSVMPSQGARKVVVFINRGHKGAYFKLDDSDRDFVLEPIDTPAVSLSTDAVMKGISFGPMQAGVPSLSALFVVYDQ